RDAGGRGYGLRPGMGRGRSTDSGARGERHHAIGAMRAAKRLGLRVPADLEVIGFDDIPLAAASDPALTTVHQPIAEKGRVATRLLIRELDEAGPRERIVLPTELLLRESTRAESTKSRGLGVAKGGTEREGKRTLKAAAR